METHVDGLEALMDLFFFLFKWFLGVPPLLNRLLR